jgi:ribosome assembly protein SQT1
VKEAVNEEEAVPPPAITTIDTDNENQLIIVGSVDGTAKLVGNSGVVGVLPASSTGSEVFPVERVLIDCPGFEMKVAVTASLNGRAIVWDVAHQSVRNECQDENPTGITTLMWAKEQTILAGTLGGAIKAWNIRNGEKKFTLLGHANNIHDLAYHEKKNLLLTVSEDKTAKIFTLPM